MFLSRCGLLLALCCGSAPAAYAEGSFLVEQQFGQATTNTCQSYVLAIALALKGDPDFRMNDWAALRAFELRFRAEIKKRMDAAGAIEATDNDSRAAMETVTGARYTLASKGELSAPNFQAAVIATTGISSENDFSKVPAFLFGSIVKDAVISSATRIEAKSYKNAAGHGSHQFVILGASQTASNSNVKYLVLNSAARRKTPSEKSIDVCTDGVPDEKSPYFASLAWTNNIDFNAPGGSMRFWSIVRK